MYVRNREFKRAINGGAEPLGVTLLMTSGDRILFDTTTVTEGKPAGWRRSETTAK
jgi:hypothetical protein